MRTLGEKNIPEEDWFTTLADIATHHLKLQEKLTEYGSRTPAIPAIKKLRGLAISAVDVGDYETADTRLCELEEVAFDQLREAQLDVSYSRALRGEMCLARLEYKAAIQYFMSAASVLNQGNGYKKADYLVDAGKAALVLRRDEQALSLFEEAVDCLSVHPVPKDLGDSLQKGPIDQTLDGRIASAKSYVALALGKLGRQNESEALFRQLLNFYRDGGKEHRANLARTANSLSFVLGTDSRQEVESLRKLALAVGVKALGKFNPDVAIWLNNLAAVYSETGRARRALRLQKYAVRIDLMTLGRDHPQTSSHLGNYGGTLARLGRHSEASQIVRDSIENSTEVLGPANQSVLLRAVSFSAFLIDDESYDEAERYLSRALEFVERKKKESTVLGALTFNNYGRLKMETGDYRRAEHLLRRGLTVIPEVFGQKHMVYATCLSNLADSFLRTGQFEKADESIELALRTINNVYSDTDDVGRLHRILLIRARISRALGRVQESQNFYTKAKDRIVFLYGDTHPDYVIVEQEFDL